MPQSLAQICLHVVFSTKHRRPFLHDDELCTEMHKYLDGACRDLESPSLLVGGVEDHAHILCRLSRKMAVSHLVAELKRESSKWIKTKDRQQSAFHWQDGYGAFSISPSHVDSLKQYLRWPGIGTNGRVAVRPRRRQETRNPQGKRGVPWGLRRD